MIAQIPSDPAVWLVALFMLLIVQPLFVLFLIVEEELRIMERRFSVPANRVPFPSWSTFADAPIFGPLFETAFLPGVILLLFYAAIIQKAGGGIE